ncbi:MAG: SURF1 family cytochrome oxidase biogenesis protein [Gordonia sp. (in: high G+C Gram-positive bacteria)]|uniref:SURF1 family cytochrome oxidase biogenesis protein n=1 Tax=Gordonia sp. (in: high G+C Gram-positive bacteria) TaxID=84139 RepID=UPI0039E551AC
MQWLRTFFKPGWVLVAVLAVVFAAACFLILAPWQLGKNTTTEHRNNLIKSAAKTGPVPIDQLAAPGAGLAPDDEWREVTVNGHYLPSQEVRLRLRSVDSQPAVEVVTPFAVAGDPDRTILVDRGYVRPGGDGSVVIAPAPTGEVSLDARLRKSEGTSPGKEPRRENGAPTAYTIDTAALGSLTGLTLDPFYLQLSDDQPGSLTPIGLPQLESGPYLSYGLQWLAFGIMAPLGVAYFVYAEVKHRRALRARAEGGVLPPPDDDGRGAEKRRIRDELRAASAPDTASVRSTAEIGAGTEPASPDDDVKAKLARRYGR